MSTNLVCGPGDVVSMSAATSAYCGLHKLQAATDREGVARRVIKLYLDGNTSKTEILAGLRRQDILDTLLQN